MREEIIPIEERINRELDLETLGQPLEVKEVFGNTHPLELEIGIGKGLFLYVSAKENPDRNYIGIEVRRKYLNKARDRVEKRPITNVRYVCGEAFQFMEEYLSPGSLAAVHIYFPDPWPKKRHHKRRLFSHSFINLVQDRLERGGRLLLVTDHADYFQWIKGVLGAQALLVPCTTFPLAFPSTEGLTNYEIKYQKEGRKIFRLGYQKS